MTQFSEADRKYCDQYLVNLRTANAHLETNEDTAKARDSQLKKIGKYRQYFRSRNKLKSPGPDVVAPADVTQLVLNMFNQIVPTPQGKTYPFEDNFLIFNRSGSLWPSKIFQMPENGGRLNYSCHLGYNVEWSSVVASAHTHPLYNDRSLDRLNKNFSAGDPSLLLLREIPVYLRTPKGKEIKVLEIRNGWVTSRRVDEPGYKAKKWVMQ